MTLEPVLFRLLVSSSYVAYLLDTLFRPPCRTLILEESLIFSFKNSIPLLTSSFCVSMWFSDPSKKTRRGPNTFFSETLLITPPRTQIFPILLSTSETIKGTWNGIHTLIYVLISIWPFASISTSWRPNTSTPETTLLFAPKILRKPWIINKIFLNVSSSYIICKQITWILPIPSSPYVLTYTRNAITFFSYTFWLRTFSESVSRPVLYTILLFIRTTWIFRTASITTPSKTSTLQS